MTVFNTPMGASEEVCRTVRDFHIVCMMRESTPFRRDMLTARKLMEAGVSVAAVRYNGTIHDFVLLNALRKVPSTEAAIQQASEGIRAHIGQ